MAPDDRIGSCCVSYCLEVFATKSITSALRIWRPPSLSVPPDITSRSSGSTVSQGYLEQQQQQAEGQGEGEGERMEVQGPRVSGKATSGGLNHAIITC